MSARQAQKRCTQCGDTKPVSEFYDGMAECRSCNCARGRANHAKRKNGQPTKETPAEWGYRKGPHAIPDYGNWRYAARSEAQK